MMIPNPNTTAATLGLLPNDQLIHKGDRVSLVLRPFTTTSGKATTREVCLHPGAVIILPVLPDGRIVFIRNRRHTLSQELLELPAGTLEHSASGPEDPAACAARELQEETGYTAGNLQSLGWFYTSPGILTEKMYAFLATDLEQGAQDLEDNEQIQPHPLTPDEAKRLLAENILVDAKSIATLLKYFIATGG